MTLSEAFDRLADGERQMRAGDRLGVQGAAMAVIAIAAQVIGCIALFNANLWGLMLSIPGVVGVYLAVSLIRSGTEHFKQALALFETINKADFE